MDKEDEQYCRRIVEQLLSREEGVLQSVAPCTMSRKDNGTAPGMAYHRIIIELISPTIFF
jgi:hypothetical protein